jgi:peptidoglycan/LPS O-acetylase OafA/YrhL
MSTLTVALGNGMLIDVDGGARLGSSGAGMTVDSGVRQAGLSIGRVAQAAQSPGAAVSSRHYYRPELDVVRFFAFLLVFICHTVPVDVAFWAKTPVPGAAVGPIIGLVSGGAYGVDLFFGLSSFLITTLLLIERETGGSVDVGAFYMRRMLRIWPLYFFFLLILTPLMQYVLPGEDMPLKYTLAFLLFAGNWACVAWGFPHSAASPLWSVSMEEQFYLAWPWIVRRWGGNLVTVALVMLAISFAARVYFIDAPHPYIWGNTLTRFDPIACGMILAVFVRRREIVLSGLARVALLLFGVIVLVLAGRYGDLNGARSLVSLPASTVACMAMIIATLGMPLMASRHPIMRVLVYLGRISYGLYVYHFLFAMLFKVAINVDPSGEPRDRAVRVVATLAATLAAAAISYQLLELPFLRLKARFAQVASNPVG